MQQVDYYSNIELIDSIIEEQKYVVSLDKQLTKKRNTIKLKKKFIFFNSSKK